MRFALVYFALLHDEEAPEETDEEASSGHEEDEEEVSLHQEASDDISSENKSMARERPDEERAKDKGECSG